MYQSVAGRTLRGMNKGIVTKVVTGVTVAVLIVGGALVWNGVTQAREEAHQAQVHHALVVAQDRKTAHLLADDQAQTRALMSSASDLSTYTTQQQQIAAEEAAQAAAAAAAQAAADAAAQQQAQLVAQQSKKTTTKTTTRSTTTTNEPVQPAAVHCPAGSISNGVDANGNDTSCTYPVCQTIQIPDPDHPECDAPFKP